MKNIILILIFIASFLEAKSCTTDIYFGNGVWNTQTQGEEGRDELKKFMQKRPLTPLTIEDEKNKLYTFKHAYNPSEGTTEDLIETFYQLKESGQISYGYFVWMAAILNIDGQTDINTKLQDIIRTHNEDAIYMFTKYENESFKKKHNVLLVAHSQGNLFGNKMYTLMNDAQKKKFRMVSVATPADHVSGGGPYVTASGDYVIVPISGSLPANVIGFGHTFLGTYLNMDGVGVPGDGSNNAPSLIASFVKTAYNNLTQNTSCTEYDYVYLYVDYTKDTIRVVGKIANVFENELITEEPLAFIESSSCGNDYPYVFMTPLLYLHIDSAMWTIGPFETQNDVALKEYSILKYQFGNHCVVKSFSGDIYDAVYGALQKN